MPALTMRGRYLMREYWSDSALFLSLDSSQRELYIGLWMLADDAGWLTRDVPAIAAALYRYEDVAPRVERVLAGIVVLRKLGKIVVPPCRRCLFLDSVAKYPRAGNKAFTHLEEHQSHVKSSQRESTMFNDVQRGSSPRRNVTLREPSLHDGSRAPARGTAVDNGKEATFKDAMEASGIKSGIIDKSRERT